MTLIAANGRAIIADWSNRVAHEANETHLIFANKIGFPNSVETDKD